MPRPLNLQRRDLAGSSTTSRGCLLMYPATKKGKQRVAMGDSSGHVEVFSIGKRLERVPAFSTVDPNDPTQTKPPVSCATLFSDQLFILRGSVLDAYSRKGRHFFSVDTNATEKLHSIAIFTPFIFVAGDFMMTTMKEMKEVGFYMAPDRILSMVVFPCWRTLQQQPSDRGVSDYLCFIGCNDRTIRLLIHNKLEAEVGCEAAVTALFFQAERYRLIYGTQAGSIGIFNVHEQGVLKRTCTHMMGHSGGGATSPTSPHSHPSPITCLTTFDVNADKKEEIVAGYEDGSLRIFSEVVGDGGPGAEVHLELLFYINVQERIMSVVGGVVCQGPEQPELLIHLFSGQLISFWLAEQEGAGAGAGAGAAPSIVAMEGAATLRVAGGVEPAQPSQRELLAAQREDAERDIHQLKDAITQQAAELARLTGAAQKQCPVVAVASTFTAQVSLHALAGRAMLSLTIDSDVALEYAVIRSAVALDAHGTESTTISTQPLEAVSSSTTKALILARPIQESGTTGGRRMEVYLRAVEGCPDTISITLYALPAPRTAQVKTVRLTALPLYARVASIDPYLSATDSAHALSRLIARSEVVLSSVEVHQWLIPLVPGIPDVALPAAKYAFASEFLGTVLLIEVMEKEIIFTSDSITALLAVRRQLQQVAADSRALHLDEDIRAASAASQLSKLEPAIQRCSAAKVSVELLQGLQELQGGEMDPTCLPERLSGLLVAPEAVMAEYERQKPQEEFVVRCVLDLYQSLVAFRRHAPLLNPSLQRDLEAACAGGRATSFARLTELFFPNREDLLEREQPPSSAAAPAANVVDELHSPMSDGGAGVGVARVMDGEPLPPSLQEGPAATTAV